VAKPEIALPPAPVRPAALPFRGLRAALALGLCAGLALAGCSRAGRTRAPAVLDPQPGLAETSYLAPPRVELAMATRDGATMIRGQAAPRARVSVASPEGDSRAAIANATGTWTLVLPPSPRPRLYALSCQQDGRAVHAEGAVLTFPRSRLPAVMLRAGAAALPLGGDGFSLLTVDYDPGGFAGVSGVAAPNAPVKLAIDGGMAGEGQTDARGRFALLAANRKLSLDPHELMVATPGGIVRSTVQLMPLQPMTGPYRVDGGPGAWRVQWALNGGGVQTTLLIGPKE
jgi:hypothetical protein